MFGLQKTGFGAGSAFGSGLSTGFGTSAFGHNTTALGANTPGPAQAFGTPSFGTATPSASIFGSGSATQPSTGLFGAGTGSAFGQTPVATSASSFGFGGTSNTGTSLFGSTTQQPTATGLFGSQSSAFGASKPAISFAGFNSGSTSKANTGLFGQNKQPSMFGGTITNTASTGSGFFGSTTGSAFGSAATAANGTTVKFNPPNGTDTMLKNGVSHNISTRHQCITTMKEYENKSLEELRTEDYLSNRKGPQAGSTATFGATAAAPATVGLFGSTPSVSSSSAFNFGGSQPSKPLFGSSGGTTSIFGPTQSAGLFGQPAAASTGFGVATTSSTGFGGFGTPSTGTSLFGQPANQQTQSTGLFSQPAATVSTGFGSTQFGSGFGGTAAQTGSLFGAKSTTFGAATTSSPFSFGSNAAVSSSGTSLFGQKPAGGSLFGAAGTTPAFGATSTGFGGFGTAATSTTQPGGLFSGQNKSLGFGTTSTAPAFGSGLTSGFGTGLGTSTGSSLFGGTATSKPAFNFGNTSLGGTGSAFGQSLGFGNTNTLMLPAAGTSLTSDNVAQQQAQTQRQLLALAHTPFGDSPLFRNVVTESGKREELLKPTNPAAQKALLTSNQLKVSPMPKVKPKSWNPSVNGKKSLFDGLEDEESCISMYDTFVPRKSVKKLILKHKSLSPANPSGGNKNNAEHSMHGMNSTLPTPVRGGSVMNNVLSITSPITSNNSLRDSDQQNYAQASSPDLLIRKYLSDKCSDSISDDNANNTIPVESIRNKSLFNSTVNDDQDLDKENLTCNDTTVELAKDEEDEIVTPELPPHPAGIVMKRPGYYTIPSLSDLADSVGADGKCLIENFTIGREGYGNVFFPGITDLTNLNIDDLVHIRRKEIIVYPDESCKPEIGQGLNKKAEITLDGVWPNDKTTRLPIKSPDRLKEMKYEEKIERCTLRMGAKFIEYRLESGSWLFQVQHFSKYGLEDSDEEDNVQTKAQKVTQMDNLKKIPFSRPDVNDKNVGMDMTCVVTAPQQQKLVVNQENRIGNSPTMFLNTDMDMTEVQPFRVKRLQRPQEDDDDEMKDITNQMFPHEDDDSIDDELETELEYASSQQLATKLGVNSHRMQVMKASFFQREEDNMLGDNRRLSANESDSNVPVAVSSNRSLLRTQLLSSKTGVISPTPINPQLQKSSVSFTPKIVKNNRRQIATPPPDLLSKHMLLPGGTTPKEQRPSVFTVRKQSSSAIPASQSLMYGKERMIVDAGCYMGRKSRVGWAPKSAFVHCGPAVGATSSTVDYTKNYNLMSMFTKKVPNQSDALYSIKRERIKWSGQQEIHQKLCDEQLEIALSNTRSTIEQGCPVFATAPGVEALHQYAENVQKNSTDAESVIQMDSFLQTWNLCVALWGRVPGLDDVNDKANTYEYRMARRQALSSWLMSVSERKILNETEKKHSECEGYLDSLVSQLTGQHIKDACQIAQSSGDHRLALLLAQGGGSTVTRQMLQKQLEIWKTTKADRFINKQRLKVFCLLAGLMVWQTSDDLINACEGLDWKRSLALHLWYHCPLTSSIVEAFTEYENAFQRDENLEKYATAPWPSYIENDLELLVEVQMECDENSSYVVQDVCYHLLKLYCDRSHQLDRVLTPTTHTPNHLDHCLSWHLFQVLKSLGYSHLSAYHADSLNVNYACQLEEAGKWCWAVFILLHISDPLRRKKAVEELLNKHVSLETDEESEKFLLEKLLIPKEWIYQAKALKAKTMFLYHDEAWYLLKAGLWNESHRIVLKYIAPDAMINEEYEYLKKFLELLDSPSASKSILDWKIGGQVFLDYIHISQSMDEIIAGHRSAYDLEKLHPEITSLCGRISSLPTNTAKEILCQSEMAKKTANLLKAVLTLQNKDSNVPTRHLVPHIGNLPMPEDYALQELQNLTRSYMLEVIES